MKGLPSAETAAYSDICEDFEQRMGNPQWKGFPPFAITVDLIRVSLTQNQYFHVNVGTMDSTANIIVSCHRLSGR